jgi:hypothetical protein
MAEIVLAAPVQDYITGITWVGVIPWGHVHGKTEPETGKGGRGR